MLKMLRPGGRRPLYFAIVSVCLLSLTAVFLWHLGSFSSGASPSELSIKSDSGSLSTLINNPVNAPYKLVLWGTLHLPHDGLLGLRLASVFYAMLFVLSFAWLAKSLFGKFSGYLGALIFLTMPLVLVLGRQASADILLLAPAFLMALYYWQEKNMQQKISWLILVAIAGLGLYVPGLNWWIILAAIYCGPKLWQDIKSTGWLTNLSAGVLLAIIITPLCVALVKGNISVSSLFLIPSHFSGILSELKAIGWMWLGLFWKASTHYPTIIGQLPVLNIVAIVLSVFGFYALWVVAAKKAYALGGSVVLAIILAGINQNINLLALALPAIGVLVCAGLRYLFIEWRSIFPRNPIARSLAVTAMCAIVVVHMVFGLRYSLIAWPHTVDTQQLYVLK
jgi:4-amino-4-deoxy-L-arabinose transferase-like glycosyltransferase